MADPKDFSRTPGDNNSIDGISTAENATLVAQVDNIVRAIMASYAPGADWGNANPAIKLDHIAESTLDAGVTVDSLLIKDGGISGGSLAGETTVDGVVNLDEGANVASAATTNVWATDGNTLHVTGTATITSLGTAPQAGAYRTVVADGAFTLTNGVNLILPGGQNIVAAAGDVFQCYADTTTQIRVTGYTRADGKAVVPPVPLTEFFESSEQTVAISTLITLPHGLSSKPKFMQLILRCAVADLGYSVGEELLYTGHEAASLNRGAQGSADDTNVYVAQAVSLPLIDKTTRTSQNITLASWRWVVRAWA